jgi:type VI protein secretion system component Hcp
MKRVERVAMDKVTRTLTIADLKRVTGGEEAQHYTIKLTNANIASVDFRMTSR